MKLDLDSISINNERYGFIFINLNHLTAASFNDYILYINENELLLPRKDKNKLGMHFILKRIIEVCSLDDTKKCFFYTLNDSLECKLVKSIFKSLPTRIFYGSGSFESFLEDIDYSVFKSVDVSSISFAKFRRFLRRYELQQIEREFTSNVNIKRSLLP
jgi:hypothetical protein